MMLYRRARIPGTGPAGSPALVLQVLPEARMQVTPEGLLRTGADARELNRELRGVNAVLRPLFGAGAGSRAPGAPWEPPDLSGYYRVQPLDARGFEDAVALNKMLRSYDAVTAAYIRPPAVLTVLPSTELDAPALDAPEPPGPTADFSAHQGYLDRADRGGIDARFAWTVPGGLGRGVKVVDVERGWCLTHEDLDLTADALVAGWAMQDLEARSHGTAVLGMLAAEHDRAGVMGICPQVTVQTASVYGPPSWDAASAIEAAANQMQPGDIMVLELQRRGPNTPVHAPRDEGYIATEWFPAELDAIRYAVSRGVIVVEAAGNGADDLDGPAYGGIRSFGPGWRNPFATDGIDSGAIMVGAGAPPNGRHGADRSRLPFSNFGSRVDVQGWGRDVATTGGRAGGPDDLRPGPDERRWYTGGFSGTSSATPMVAGALACIQGMLRAAGRPLLTPLQARQLVREEGLPQEAVAERPHSQRIGRRPDVRAYHERVFHGAPLDGGARRPARRHEMATTKITITVEGGDVQISGNGAQLGATQQTSGQNNREWLAQLISDPQWKGPSLAFTGPDGEVVAFKIHADQPTTS